MVWIRIIYTVEKRFDFENKEIKEVKEQVVEDAKQRFRFTSIEEEGDDPANPFKKIGGKGRGEGGDDGFEDLGGKHGGGGKMPDLDDLEDLEGGPEGEEGGGSDLGGLDKIKETKSKKKSIQQKQSVL